MASFKMLKTNVFFRSRTIPLVALAIGLAIGLTALPQAPRAQEAANPLAGMQKEAVEQLVREYLLAHPEVVVEALHRYEQQQQTLESERLKEALAAAGPELIADPADPVLGNPDGDVTLVEFFDYRCGYCKRMTGTLAQLIEEDGNLRVVMKEFPILSRESVVAAHAAMAAVRQGKYEAFHFALMKDGGSFTDGEVMAIAESVGLDTARLASDMRDPNIAAALQRTKALAESIGINGTPAFIIGDTMIPGATSLEALRAQIAEARAKAS